MLRHSIATAVVSTAALLSLAACSDTMGPTMPNAADRPADAPALAKGKDANFKAGVTGTLAVVQRYYSSDDETWVTEAIPYTGVRFSGASFDKYVQDNLEGDGDARVGYYSVQLPGADTYKAVLVKVPSPFTRFGMTSTAPYASPTTRFPSLMPHKSPQIKVYFVSNLTGEKVFGRGATITGPNGFSFSAIDGGTNDTKNHAGAYYPADGRITTYVPELATYKACQITLGFFNPPCATGTPAAWDDEFDVLLPVKP